MTEPLDHRLAAYRPDLADLRLKGRVEAEDFVEGELARIAVPSAPLRRTPRPDASLDTEALRGEIVRVFEETIEGWAWVQLQTDSYVGYLSSDVLGAVEPEPTHRVVVPRTFLYPGPEMKLPASAALSFGATLTFSHEVQTRDTRFLVTADGAVAVVARHVVPIDAPPSADFVAVAETFLNVPYLWGGRTSIGLDCSALTQLSLAACGIAVPRDTDLQEMAIGVLAEGPIQRGDLLFWKGHVGIAADGDTLLHASGFQMQVVKEPLADVLARIGQPTSVRRLA